MNHLDELLGSEEPHATFHDAEVVRMSHDPGDHAATVVARLCVGDPDAASLQARSRRRDGVLQLRGVRHWRREAAAHAARGPANWLADDGPLIEGSSVLAQDLARELGPNEIGWYFYFADSNSFVYWIAAEAEFRWLAVDEPAG